MHLRNTKWEIFIPDRLLLKEYSTSISLYNRIAAQEDDEERRLAIKLMLARMALSIGSEKEAERYFKDVASLCGDQLQLYKFCF